jgi:topoisomerase-4 subunit A
VYYDGERDLHFVKRFLCEVTVDKKVSFISEAVGSYMDAVTTAYRPEVRIVYNKLLKETKNLPDNIIQLADFIEVKGLKAQGNQLTKLKVKEIVLTHPIEGAEPWPEEEKIVFEEPETNEDSDEAAPDEMVNDGTTIEWDFTDGKEESDDDQMTLF